MGLGRRIGLLTALAILGLAAASPANGDETHVYAVSLTIVINQETGKIDGAVVTDAPSEFCDSSRIRVREVKKGKDPVIARVAPYGGQWHMTPTAALHGERIYAEVSKYHLPSRPAVCLAARSPAITVP